MPSVYDTGLPPGPFADLPPPTGALMADPADFQVVWEINAHMSGRAGSVDVSLAHAQWTRLREALEAIGLEILVVPASPGLCDLVFTANQSFPMRDGSRRMVLAKMRAFERAPEVLVVAKTWTQAGYLVQPLPGDSVFEAGGDALWVPGHRWVLCGHGFRTDRPALDELALAIDAPIVAFHLQDERFYHLDTCLCPLDSTCALYVAEAFSEADVARILQIFPQAVAISVDEATTHFSCNGASIRGHFLVQRGADQAIEVARSRGLVIVELDTGEFLKSGGSVTCLHNVF